jgi:hypothetical protein
MSAAVEGVASDLHDIAWFAARTGLKVPYLRKNIATIPHRKIGRLVRFTEADVDAFIASRAVEARDPMRRTSRSAGSKRVAR